MDGKLLCRMHQNETPFPPQGKVAAAARAAVLSSHHYPSRDAAELRGLLAEWHDVGTDWVAAGSGSISVIQQAMIVAGPGELIVSWPSFEAFPPLAMALGMSVKLANLRSDGSCDLADMAGRITPTTRLAIVCTPNTPTGGIIRHDELAAFVAAVPDDTLVLVDEAYGEFVTSSDAVRTVELIRRHSNVMMTRTFSKAFGLAGFRVGYGIAQPVLASAIRAAGVPFALTRAAEAAAMQAVRGREAMRMRVEAIKVERARLTAGLRALGVDVRSGHGNFVWLPHTGDVLAIADELASSGVLVKPYPGHGIRITVGTRADTARLLSASRTSIRGERPNEMSPEQRVGWEAEGAFDLRRQGPHRRAPDVGDADRLRDDPTKRCRGAGPAAVRASTGLSAARSPASGGSATPQLDL